MHSSRNALRPPPVARLLAMLLLSAQPAGAASFSTTPMISAGVGTDLMLSSDGIVWSQGGSLGNGSSSAVSTTPTQVVALHNAIGVSVGHAHSLVVQSDGTVWAWGSNEDGELGTGDRNERLFPVRVEGIEDAVAVSAGHSHSVALKRDGTAWSWGGYEVCRRGTPVETNPLCRPTQLSGLSGVRAISAGTDYTLALKEDGTVWAWGGNEQCQLGDGTTTPRTDPVQVAGLSGVVSISASEGGYYSLAVTEDGSLWWWGSQSRRPKTRCLPGVSAGIGGIVAAAAGDSIAALLKADGTVWRLSSDSHTTAPEEDWETPTRVPRVAGAVAIDATWDYAKALLDDGTVWSWGFLAPIPVGTPGPDGTGYLNLLTPTTGNTTPVAHDFYRTMDSGTSLKGTLTGGDAEESPLTFTLVEAPAQGTLKLESDGAFRYTPPAAFTGNVTFRYRVSDGEAESAPATATVVVVDCTLHRDPDRLSACFDIRFGPCDFDGDGRPDYADRFLYIRHCTGGPLTAPPL